MAYRKIQVLALIGNPIQQQLILLPMIIVYEYIPAITLVSLIRTSWSRATLHVAILFLIICLNVVLTNNTILNGFAEVYKESKRFKRTVKKSIMRRVWATRMVSRKKEMDWMMKFVRSCSVIKIKFGSLNFVEEFTPLLCIAFTIETTVNLLLLTE